MKKNKFILPILFLSTIQTTSASELREDCLNGIQVAVAAAAKGIYFSEEAFKFQNRLKPIDASQVVVENNTIDLPDERSNRDPHGIYQLATSSIKMGDLTKYKAKVKVRASRGGCSVIGVNIEENN